MIDIKIVLDSFRNKAKINNNFLMKNKLSIIKFKKII